MRVRPWETEAERWKSALRAFELQPSAPARGPVPSTKRSESPSEEKASR